METVISQVAALSLSLRRLAEPSNYEYGSGATMICLKTTDQYTYCEAELLQVGRLYFPNLNMCCLKGEVTCIKFKNGRSVIRYLSILS